MDTAVVLKNNPSCLVSNKIHFSQLLDVFEEYSSSIKVLSLDCFDTLLFRKTASPMDVFYDLENRPSFRSLGFSALLRLHSEGIARNINVIQRISSEVTLRDIYLAGNRELSEDQLTALAEDELLSEIKFCYAFPLLVEVIRRAKKSGIKIVVVSDTYFKTQELERLLSHCLPADVFSAIDTIFCSCEAGVSKVNGLFKHVLSKLNYPADSILHLGDNPSADLDAPNSHGISAIQLLHHDEDLKDIFRMQYVSASLLDPSIRYKRPLMSPFHGVFAAQKTSVISPASLIGYASLGPIFYSFGKFICKEIAELERSQKKPKVLFLMRDAHLPFLACEALIGQAPGKKGRISRFCVTASSFKTLSDIDRYLSEVVWTNRFPEISKQLLFSEKETDELIKISLSSPSPSYRFTQLVQEKKDTVISRSSHYRERLKRYLEKEIGLKRGDTLLLIDLGYSGTTQTLLSPIFKEEMNVDIVGRYLIALPVVGWEKTRKGLLDAASCDDRAMRTLVAYIALLEQLCTACENSVVDYDESGNPVFSESGVNQNQHEKIQEIQEECIRFIKEADHFFQSANITIEDSDFRDSTIAGLGRLLFLPSAAELEYLKQFQFDINLGTKDLYRLFDSEEGLVSLRRRGLFSFFMEKNAKSLRTNIPAELRSAGVELTLAMVTHQRFGLEFSVNDLNLRRESLNVITLRGQESNQTVIQAMATHDGYFSLVLPLGKGDFQVGILFGQKYRWIQFESATLIKAEHFLKRTESIHTEDCWNQLMYHQMTKKTEKLFECETKAGVMVLPEVGSAKNNNLIFRVVFRPIVD